jgi:hypothetical protein
MNLNGVLYVIASGVDAPPQRLGLSGVFTEQFPGWIKEFKTKYHV